LVEPTILFFLGFYVLSERMLIHPNRGNKIPPGPEMLPGKVLSLPNVGDNENGPKDDNIGLPIDSHLIIPVIPREKQK